ncbi:OLC1v1012288C1 [Oldenlandia corymbosa var. corymbosa]|uniref:OLC1v1012288C1 n=1 Tax=Oldenlandia corymbosa var. corymbosa TaxID=529605 RepID=A0AAV1DVK5_OLDCO|nr:OLC1v1012288C1 [Oldenlandia corymbosa var. corymbosa]
MFIGCLAKCAEAGKDINLINAIASIEDGLSTLIIKNDGEDLDFVTQDLLNKFEQLEPEITDLCVVLLDSLRSMSCSSDEILKLLDCLVGNFQDLDSLKDDIIVSSKNQIIVIGRKLSVLRTLVDFSAKRCNDNQMLDYFLNYVKDLVDSAASLSLLCLLERKDGAMAAQGLETSFTDHSEKCLPCTPEVTEMFIGLLKASKSSRSDKFRVSEEVFCLVDFILKDLVDPSKDYSTQILKEGLIMMITFLMDPTDEAVTIGGDGIFPRMNVVDENLQEMVKHYSSRIAYAEPQVMIVHKEIMSSAHAFLHTDDPIWYDMLQLLDVIEAIKLIQTKAKKYSDQLYKKRMSKDNFLQCVHDSDVAPPSSNAKRLLNVLDLERINIDGPFPQEITLIIHLRYLAILCEATELPESILNLWNLETLIVKHLKDIVLPETFWRMKSLRHVDIGSLYLNGLEDREYSQLENLEMLSTLRRFPRIRKLKFDLLED